MTDETRKMLIEYTNKILEKYKIPEKKEYPTQNLFAVEFFYHNKRTMKLPNCLDYKNAINWVNKNGIQWTHLNLYMQESRLFVSQIKNEPDLPDMPDLVKIVEKR